MGTRDKINAPPPLPAGDEVLHGQVNYHATLAELKLFASLSSQSACLHCECTANQHLRDWSVTE